MKSSTLLDSIASSKAPQTLRPIMHQFKVLTPLMCAYNERIECGEDAHPILDILYQLSLCTKEILQDLGIPQDAQTEWQHGLVRKSILPFAIEDVKSYGYVKGKWKASAVELIHQLKIQEILPVKESPTLQLRMTQLDALAKLAQHNNDFSFLHEPKQLTKELFEKILIDAEALAVHIDPHHSPDFKNLHCNLIRNLTSLMCSALARERFRIQSSLTQEVIAEHRDGLPLDGVISTYQESQDTLLECLDAPLEHQPLETLQPAFMR